MEPYRDLATYNGASSFEGAVGKIGRAKYQLRDLEARFESVLGEWPLQLSEALEMRPGENVGDYTFTVEIVAVPKREWAVLIGEVVHNLRSALDHAVYAAAESPDGKTAFPVITDPAKWDGRSVARKLRSVPPAAVEIVKRVQPFVAAAQHDPAEHPLALLERLWNHDKHRMLQTAVMAVSGAAPGFRGSGTSGFGTLREVSAAFGPLREGDPFVRFTLEDPPLDVKLELVGEFDFYIVFADTSGEPGRGIEGLPVHDVLLSAYRQVNHVVISLEVACKGAAQAPA